MFILNLNLILRIIHVKKIFYHGIFPGSIILKPPAGFRMQKGSLSADKRRGERGKTAELKPHARFAIGRRPVAAFWPV
jgi:hypothetical protein